MLADHLTSAENTVTFSSLETGYMPVRSDAAHASALYAENPNFEVAVDQLETRTRTQDDMRVSARRRPHPRHGAAAHPDHRRRTSRRPWPRSQTELQGRYENDLRPQLEGRRTTPKKATHTMAQRLTRMDVTLTYPGASTPSIDAIDLEIEARRVPRARRALGLRQVDDAARGRRASSPRPRAHRVRRPRRHWPRRQPSGTSPWCSRATRSTRT